MVLSRDGLLDAGVIPAPENDIATQGSIAMTLIHFVLDVTSILFIAKTPLASNEPIKFGLCGIEGTRWKSAACLVESMIQKASTGNFRQ